MAILRAERRRSGSATGEAHGEGAPQQRFLDAVLADARIACAARHERHEFRSRLDGVRQACRLALQTDAFLALAAYRAEARLRTLGVPFLPWLTHRLAVSSAGISIGPDATVHPGIVIPHGQVVIDGVVEVQPFVTLLPWVTIGPIGGGGQGPTIRGGAVIGTGAKVMGEIEVGAGARVGVNAVVLDDVAPGTTVVGMPAAPVEE